MTANHRLRRVLARVCSAETMARVVDPTLADIRWESGRPFWLGCLSLAKALLIHAIASTPGMLSHAWSDDERAIPKAAAFVTAGALCAAVPLMAPPLINAISREWTFSFAVAVLLPSLVPQALALTLPAALLLAFPVAFGRQQPSARLARRSIVMSMGVAVLTFAVIAWLVPAANQSFRVGVSRIVGESRDVRIERGPMELTPAELRERIEVLQLTPGGRVVARGLEYVYQMRLALAVAPVPLGLLALCDQRLPARAPAPLARRRQRDGVLCLRALSDWKMVATGVDGRAASNLPPFLFAWAPNAAARLSAPAISLLVGVRRPRVCRRLVRQLPSPLEHRLHQAPERLGGEGIGEREALEIVEIGVRHVAVRIGRLDPGRDRGQRVGGAAGAAHGGLQRLDFGHIRHIASLYRSYRFGTADRQNRDRECPAALHADGNGR